MMCIEILLTTIPRKIHQTLRVGLRISCSETKSSLLLIRVVTEPTHLAFTLLARTEWKSVKARVLCLDKGADGWGLVNPWCAWPGTVQNTSQVWTC